MLVGLPYLVAIIGGTALGVTTEKFLNGKTMKPKMEKAADFVKEQANAARVRAARIRNGKKSS
jgi:hypothetical protein